jgi:hypothetical protein
MHHPVTNSVVIGKAPDGSLLRSWTEGERTFIESYAYATAKSGITYGCVIVIETTA